MAEFKDRLNTLCEVNNINDAHELAKKIGVSTSAIYMYKRGERIPKYEIQEALADLFNCDIDYLLGRSDIANKSLYLASIADNTYEYNPTNKIPILGQISAGLPLYADQQLEGYTYTELNGGAEYFALRIKGDSMDAARMQEGDLIIVRRQSYVDNGQIAVVLVNEDDATVKRFYKKDNIVTLYPQSTNSKHKPQIYNLAENSIMILGLVVEIKIKV